MSTVSIVIPCCNRASLIGHAIESALGQSYQDVEVIVVDDGSTDNSWSMIRSFGRRIRSIQTRNHGASAARNTGLKHARGRFIKFLDSDDLLERDVIENQLKDIEHLPDGSIPVGIATCIDLEGKLIVFDKYNLIGSRDGAPIPREILIRCCTQVSLPLFPTRTLEAVGGFREDLTICEDYDLVLRLHLAGYRFHLFQTLSSRIREHDTGRVTMTAPAAAYTQLQRMLRDHLAAFEGSDEGPLDAEERALHARLVWSFARVAARRGHSDAALGLFAIGNDLAGRRAWSGSRAIRFLYRFLDPVTSEKIVGAFKFALGRQYTD